jgi:hypothetical protein
VPIQPSSNSLTRSQAGTQGSLAVRSPPGRDELVGSGRNEPLAESIWSSCAGLTRASTSCLECEGVDARGTSPWAEGPQVKPGQDETGKRDSVEQLLKTAMRADREIAVILV